jgi:putative MFS transporter
VFVWGALGVLFLALYGKIEESPRWYETRGRLEDADAVLARIESQVKQDAGFLPAPIEIGKAPAESLKVGDLFGNTYLPRTVVLVFSWICLTLGFFGFTSWVPTLLVAHGFSLVHSLAWSSTMSLATIPGAMLAALISDRFDRKWSITVIAVIIAICGAFYGLTFRVGFIIVFGFLVEMFLHTFMPLVYSYTAESFPSGIRNSGTGLAYGAGRLANVMGPLIIAYIFTNFGYVNVFVYFSGIWLVTALVIGLIGKKSREL